MTLTKRIAIGLTAAVLAAAGGFAISQASSSGTSGSSALTAQAGGPGRPDLSALAKDLGVSESKLQAAMQANRPAAGGAPTDMAAGLAKALGLSESKVQSALDANRPSGAPSGGGPPMGSAPATTTS
jgi:hypothetical protein